jgi:eukaryotic-like serine/threonine-protein kinase
MHIYVVVYLQTDTHKHILSHSINDSHNVLITDDCRAKLTDFGLSQTASTITDCSTTKSSFTGGTLAWTAPEVFAAKKASGNNFSNKSDVYR